MSPFTLEHSRWAYRADFALYGGAVVLFATFLLVAGPPGMRLEIWALALLGLVGWSALEYALHRFVLHGLPPFKRWHAQHHRRPQALMGAPTWLSLSLFGLGAALPAWSLLPLQAALPLLLGLLLGYTAYISTHHWLHHAGGPKFEWQRRRLRWHARHHERAGSRRQTGHYGVTTALWDRLLGTGGRASRRALLWQDEATDPEAR